MEKPVELNEKIFFSRKPDLQQLFYPPQFLLHCPVFFFSLLHHANHSSKHLQHFFPVGFRIRILCQIIQHKNIHSNRIGILAKLS